MSALALDEGFKIAVLLPCHNDGRTVEAAVRGFAEALPDARIYVFDNNSTDDTARLAARAGARVFPETQPGRGSVVRRMFADIEADIYLMATADGRSDPTDASSLVNALVTERVDMVVAVSDEGETAHGTLGARAADWMSRRLTGRGLADMRSGYRAFTRRFVKSFPAMPSGLPMETELSLHARQLMIPVAEIALSSGPQPVRHEGGRMRDGSLRQLALFGRLLTETRPFAFCASFALFFWAMGLLLAAPALAHLGAAPQAQAGLDIAMAFFVIGFTVAGCGLILDRIGRSRAEQNRILFLAVPALGAQ